MSELTNGAKQYQTMTDGNGVWMVETANDLRPGLHRVTVQNGSTDREFFLFRPTDAYLPAPVYWLLIALIATAAFLSVYDRRAVTEESTTKSASRRRALRANIRNAAAVAAVLLAVAGLVLVWHGGGRARIARVTDDMLTGAISREAETADVEGEVSALVENEPVTGLDVSAGDTTIRITEGGRFRFSAVNPGFGLRLNHPRLLKTVVKTIDGPVTDIPYSTDLLNLLIRVVDMESRGRIEQVVALADEGVAVEISKALDYRSIFNLDNVPDQELTVGAITVLPNYNSVSGVQYGPVVRVEAVNGERSAPYHFVFRDGSWRYIR